jgi:uncharacterized membrane protein YraQ (UPF0718 family)
MCPANNFFHTFLHYTVEVLPWLALGFLLSGIIHVFVPSGFINRHLGGKGFLPVFKVTIIGMFLPVCCIGSLPIAVTLRKQGVSIGTVLAFIVATPATSISALLVCYALLGFYFTLAIFFSSLVLGLSLGLTANAIGIKAEIKDKPTKEKCPHCKADNEENEDQEKPDIHLTTKDCSESNTRSIFYPKAIEALKYGFWKMPKDLLPEIIAGLFIAALIASFSPVGDFVKEHLSGSIGYLFSLVLGLVMYVCSTASVPMVDAFIRQGLLQGAGLVMLLVGPVTSLSTIFTIRKHFGNYVLLLYILFISVVSLLFGFIFDFIV